MIRREHWKGRRSASHRQNAFRSLRMQSPGLTLTCAAISACDESRTVADIKIPRYGKIWGKLRQMQHRMTLHINLPGQADPNVDGRLPHAQIEGNRESRVDETPLAKALAFLWFEGLQEVNPWKALKTPTARRRGLKFEPAFIPLRDPFKEAALASHDLHAVTWAGCVYLIHI